jgi:hypothetical protein
MKNQPTSIRMTDATERQVAQLQTAGFGNLSNIVAIAIDRMAREDRNDMSNQYKSANYVAGKFEDGVYTLLSIHDNKEDAFDAAHAAETWEFDLMKILDRFSFVLSAAEAAGIREAQD